ncbi:protein DGS1, mitochondrial isoform X3 [Hevea brasiliensis]|uniref:protein DGS1, mitochondrial isoform X3 n=1 Tax=Hevea brasiliensis TaxID=3981 RepID=UPI0025E4280C|nr:protein DGS1, mitochondrial isoform X3 [Hevea brasiliensis]
MEMRWKWWQISNLFRQTARVSSSRRRHYIHLPLPSYTPESSLVVKESSVVYDVLEDIMEHIFVNLHSVEKNLQFWQSRAERSNYRKLYFMIFERGPRAFVDGTVQLVQQCVVEGPSMQHLCQSASAYISERLAALTTLRRVLATLLAKVYMEVDRCGKELVKDPEKSFPSLLVTINGLFSNLEASIGHLHAIRRTNSSVDGSYSFPLLFERLPEVNQEGSQWTECEIADAINLVNKNIQKLDSYLSLIDAKAVGRGRIARCQRRLLLVEVEKRILQYQSFVDQGLEKESQCMFGLVLYSLDCLFHAVKRHAKETGEWQCLPVLCQTV